ncbi:Hypothetical predicted protein [Octopus vulgaris]|uniref:Uncharacterized protein n=1 Tax=Octopus vulgaris TaxID=6645 RepID=A0AA36F0L1_OCTVU|nr:Hypothetical predicted protein [Octopus vulgaris]
MFFAQAVVDTHYKFHLQDHNSNGKSFVKVFMQFGTKAEFLSEIPEADADLDVDLDPEVGDVDKVEYIFTYSDVSFPSTPSIVGGF